MESPAHDAPSSLANFFVDGDLRDDMGRGAKAVETEPSGISSHSQGAIANQPGTKQGGGLRVRLRSGNREAVAMVGDCIFRIAAVDLIAGKPCLLAEVLTA